MEKYIQKIKGFTMLELIIVIALITTSLGFVLVYSQTTQVRTDLHAQADQFISYARLAQSRAKSGEGDERIHGIIVEQTEYTIYYGSGYSPEDTRNYTIELPPQVEIQNISLNSGKTEIRFSAPEGETEDYGTLEFVSHQNEETVSLEITKVGTINY